MSRQGGLSTAVRAAVGICMPTHSHNHANVCAWTCTHTNAQIHTPLGCRKTRPEIQLCFSPGPAPGTTNVSVGHNKLTGQAPYSCVEGASETVISLREQGTVAVWGWWGSRAEKQEDIYHRVSPC